MIHDVIKQALSPLGVPVEFHEYNGNEDTYITFFQYDEQTALSLDDEEAYINYFFQINVFSKSNYVELVKQVKEAMKGIGGTRSSEIDMKHNEWYQRSIRFLLTKNKGELE